MVKCEFCKEKLAATFLNKPLGIVVKDEKGQRRWVCSACHRGKTKEELLTAM